jgi:hypothetical protein
MNLIEQFHKPIIDFLGGKDKFYVVGLLHYIVQNLHLIYLTQKLIVNFCVFTIDNLFSWFHIC